MNSWPSYADGTTVPTYAIATHLSFQYASCIMCMFTGWIAVSTICTKNRFKLRMGLAVTNLVYLGFTGLFMMVTSCTLSVLVPWKFNGSYVSLTLLQQIGFSILFIAIVLVWCVCGCCPCACCFMHSLRREKHSEELFDHKHRESVRLVATAAIATANSSLDDD